MNKWKITSLVSVAAIILLSSVLGWQQQLLNNPSEPEIPEKPGDTLPQNTEKEIQTEKPIFHMFDVDIERIEYGGYTHRISFKAQNLGNVSATVVVFAFEIKLGGDSCRLYAENETGQEERIPFVWFIGNVTVDVIESKKVDEYFAEIPIDFWIEENITGITNPKNIEILESHWNVTCAEGVTETFDF